MTLTLAVQEGTLTIPNLEGTTLVSGTGTNDKQVVLYGTPAQLNQVLNNVVYNPAINGSVLSLDVLTISAQGSPGLTTNVTINLYITRSLLGGVATAVNVNSVVPAGETLTSATVTNWDASQFTVAPTVAADGSLAFTAVNGQNGGSTQTTVVVKMVYADGTTANVNVQLTIYHPLLQVITSTSSAAQLNPQTSLYEQVVHLTNTTPFSLVAYSVAAPGLPSGVVLESASGYDTSGNPFISGIAQIAPGAEVDLVLEYFSPNAKPFPNPSLVLTLQGTSGLPTPTGTILPVAQVITAYEGRIYLEFQTVAGKTYYVQYRDSSSAAWQTSFTPVLGTGTWVTWMDNGQPKTASVPTTARTYQLIQVATSAQ